MALEKLNFQLAVFRAWPQGNSINFNDGGAAQNGPVNLSFPFFWALNLILQLILQGKVCALMPFTSWPLLIICKALSLSLFQGGSAEYIKKEPTAPIVDC